MTIVDTSVLVDLFRGARSPQVEELRRLDGSGDFGIPTICCQELLQGARDEGEWRLLREYLATQDLVGPADGWGSHLQAARIYFDGRRRGVTIRSTVDCLIAQIALEREAVLLHSDADFDAIAGLTPLKVWRP